MNWARSVIRSPGLRGESSEWAMPSTASFTSTSMCSPSSLPCQSAAASSGYRDDRPARTLRTVAPLTHQEEEDLEPREVRERLEGLHVVLPRLESRER